MNEQKEQFGSNGSSPFSDETIRLYLLCRLSDDERLKFDKRLLIDDELAERVALAESELTDDYASDKLNTVERELFEKKFLVTQARKQKLKVSMALQNYVASQANTKAVLSSNIKQTKPSLREALVNLFGFNRHPAWAIAISFAVLILFIGVVWFVSKRLGRDNKTEIVETIPTPSPQVSRNPNLHLKKFFPIPRPTPHRTSVTF